MPDLEQLAKRIARLVLVTPEGRPVGSLAPVLVSTPWWQDVGPVVSAIRDRFGIEVVVLRLLEADRDGPPGGLVTYLAQVAEPVDAEPFSGPLPDHPLRAKYARPGGPDADLAWACSELALRGLKLSGTPVQVRTWNLSSLWRLPLGGTNAWLKVVPPFFEHEGSVLELLSHENVPRLWARQGVRLLLKGIDGIDLHDPDLAQALRMVTLLVEIQSRFIDRTDQLLASGLPDWRLMPLQAAIASALRRNEDQLTPMEVASLHRFVEDLVTRYHDIRECRIPDTIVHGDFHSGNLRGNAEGLTLLDWADSGVGHPLLDQAAFLERIDRDNVETIRQHWYQQWRQVLPGSDPQRAAELLLPVAAARQAVIYQNFLDCIEPSEHAYHLGEPLKWLRAAAKAVA